VSTVRGQLPDRGQMATDEKLELGRPLTLSFLMVLQSATAPPRQRSVHVDAFGRKRETL
jgi:hypothetical protein